MEHMTTEVKLKWKLKKFQDTKLSQLTNIILNDNGQSDIIKILENTKKSLEET